MDYIIKKTDYSINGQFTIKPYTTNGPATPTQAVPLDEHAVSANTSLILLGKGMYDYGDIIASNFVHLLENFAGPNEPAYPIQGQLWFKNTTGELFIYNNGSFTNQSLVINGQLASNLNVNLQRIVNLGAPVDPTDATTKGYVDNNFVMLAGDTMSSGANLTFVGGEVLGLPAVPSGNTAASSKKYVDDTKTAIQAWATGLFLPLTGGTLTGNLILSANTHIFLPTPIGGFVTNNDVVNKEYVDNVVSSSTAFVKKVGDTMSGTLNITGDTLYSGASLTVVAATASSNTIEVSGGDFTTSFTAGIQFTATLGSTIYPNLTTQSSVFNSGPNTTTITVFDDITTNEVSGIVSRVYGLALLNNASLFLNGEIIINGIHSLDFGGNRLTNLNTPTANGDAATKEYVDNAVTAAITVDGTLASIEWSTTAANTLQFNSTVGSPISIGGVSPAEHNHIADEILVDVTADSVTNSLMREAFRHSITTYPSVPLSTVINTIDSAIASIAVNDRYVYPVTAQNIIAIADPLPSDLTIVDAITGAGGGFKVVGDYTTTFLPGVEFTVFGNTGLPTDTVYQTLSSTFGGGQTTITVIGTVSGAVTDDGFIQRIYGAFKFNGDISQQFSTNIRVRMIGNSGSADTDFTLERNSRDPAHTTTWLYVNSIVPMTGSETATGYILPYSILLPNFGFTVEGNTLMVFRQGIKQYASTRGYSEIEIEDATPSSKILSWYPTPLTTGSYSFDITVNGGATNTVTILPVITPFTITAVDVVNDIWTITGAPPNHFNHYSVFQVSGNTESAANTIYTVKSAVYNNTTFETSISVYEDINSNATVSGNVYKPYTYGDMFDDIQDELIALYPTATPIVRLWDGRMRIYSPTVGTGSSVVIADVSLFLSWADAVIDNKAIGATYGYAEAGVPFNAGGIIELDYLPTLGEVYELINMR